MIRQRAVARIRELAASLGLTAKGSEWHLFGSVDRDDPNSADIDLMILCTNDSQADLLRQAIDPDALWLPLHLSFMTFDEASAIDAVHMQRSRPIFP